MSRLPELPTPGDYPPGERRVSTVRPAHWTVEWDGHEGLAYDAYATTIRAPYLQRVTHDSAEVLWRVSPPQGLHDLVRPALLLRPGEPFALRLGDVGYLGYVEREVGINLGWSEQAWAQWELRGSADPVARGEPVALYNRAAGDYLVYAQRRRGVDLRWLADTRQRRPDQWQMDASLPGLRLRNLRRRGPAHLVYRERRYGVNLAWGARPVEPNFRADRLHLEATLWVAHRDKPITEGQRLTATDGEIWVSEVSWTYLYRPGVRTGRAVRSAAPHLRLPRVTHRPTLQGEAHLQGLRPAGRYHYRLECQAADPLGRASVDRDALHRLADDVQFRTAPRPERPPAVRWLAVGDLGPGKRKPSYVYDVSDLLQTVARRHDAQLWLPLGDLDNDTNGHPNAADPFFFSVFNAHRGPDPVRTTTPHAQLAAPTQVAAFATPADHGLLGGLPTFPTFGNHDVCLQSGGSAERLRRFYLGNFRLPGADDAFSPAAADFNAAGRGLFYTFRWGRVIFVSLGLPMIKGCRVSATQDWRHAWGRRQETALVRFLSATARAIARPDVWLVAYFHDHHCAVDPPGRAPFPRLLLQHGVDLALAGHKHHFEEHDVVDGDRHLRAVVVGTGGFGDPDPGDHCRRPGVLLLEAQGDTLRYWKYDTHRCAPADPRDYVEGSPLGRDARHWHVAEYCRMTKTGRSAHRVEQRRLDVPVTR